MHEHLLGGCAPVPLAHYLKALGVLRLVVDPTDGDPNARGCWTDAGFVLQTRFDHAELQTFFLEKYKPTPVVAPWNGGSGFGPKDNQQALNAILAGTTTRLTSLREAILAGQAARKALNITEKVESPEQKELLLRRCRATMPDEALSWLDAAVVLTDDGAKYPPLLGTGGNDGRLDFTNNFMQRLVDLLDPETGRASAASPLWLKGALFGEPIDGLQASSAIGQFFPGAAGGANATTGYAADSLINPWDFVLMLEGAMVFAGAAVKRLGPTAVGALAYPFTVRQVGAGYGSAAETDEKEARAEIWLPLWKTHTGALEIQALFAEGRAQVNRRTAANGVDFVRAISTLGVDRGIWAFERYGFQVRNGLAYFATPLGKFVVRRNPAIELLDSIDTWLVRFRRAATGETAPASISRALRALEDAIFELCRTPSERVVLVQNVLIALGTCERAMVRSHKWTADAYLHPVPPLSKEWLNRAKDDTPEFRLAASLASSYQAGASPLRRYMEPVEQRGKDTRWTLVDDPAIVWGEGDLVRNLTAVLSRRAIENVRKPHAQPEQKPEEAIEPRPSVEPQGAGFPGRSRWKAPLADVAVFIAGDLDDSRLSDLIEALILVDWRQADFDKGKPVQGAAPPALYALAKLCYFSDPPENNLSKSPIPVEPEIHRRLASGDGAGAALVAIRRLRSSGLPPAVSSAHSTPYTARRIAAALLFDVAPSAWTKLAHAVVRTQAMKEGVFQ